MNNSRHLVERFFVRTGMFNDRFSTFVRDAEKLRGDEARLDHHYLDPELCKLAAQSVRNGFQSVFCGVRHRRQRPSYPTCNRADVDYSSALLFAHHRNNQLSQRDEREEVCFKVLANCINRDHLYRTTLAVTRVVDERVYPAECSQRLLHPALAVRRSVYVARDRQCAPTR